MKRLLALAALLTLGATSPPLVTAANINVVENAGTASIVLTKAKASSYSKVTLQTVDGTAKAGVDYTPVSRTITLSNSATRYAVPVAILDNATYQGMRTFTVRLTCTRYCSAQTVPVTVTIADDETPPAPVPTPAPTPNTWVSATMVRGGYIRCKAVGGCHGGYNGAAVVAAYGTVLQGVITDGWAMDGSMVIAAWPIGQLGVPYAGIESPASEWEGVVSA